MMANTIKHILVFSEQYPTKSDPVYAFVDQIARAFAILEVDVSVIAPQSITKHFLRKTPLHPCYRVEKVEGGRSIEIYQPFFRFENQNA